MMQRFNALALKKSLLKSRLLSSAAAQVSKSFNARSCPHQQSHGISLTSDSHGVPRLHKVPSLPVVGSMIPEHSGMPKFDLSTQYDINNEIRRRFGNFSSFGFPGFGIGSHGTLYNIYDPNEMVKVVRNEGDRPSGIVEILWSWRRALKDSGSALISKKEMVSKGEEECDYGLFDHGDQWKRQRTFLQTGMLDPVAAREFVPSIVEAARLASQVAPAHANDVNEFLNYSAFDMFCSFMFGSQTKTASTVVSDDPKERGQNAENELFVHSALGLFRKNNRMNMLPMEKFLASFVPFYKTKNYKDFEQDWNTVRRIGLKKIRAFIVRYDNNELDEMEKTSYLARAIERQRKTDEVTEDEMVELCLTSLFVGVDTTSNVTAWNLMHLAMNPDIQEKLHTELRNAVAEKGSGCGVKLNADVLGKKVSPYLHMCVRESHRATPAFNVSMWKGNSKGDVEIHNEVIPKGSMVQLGHISYDPEYVEDPKSFRPERWTAEAVEKEEEYEV